MEAQIISIIFELVKASTKLSREILRENFQEVVLKKNEFEYREVE